MGTLGVGGLEVSLTPSYYADENYFRKWVHFPLVDNNVI